MPAEELFFGPSPGFGEYKPFLEHAAAHPAKANTYLIEFLIRSFTEPGDTILDPMCGSGSTGVIAALLGRNAIQVDIEQKFVNWAEEARRKVERTITTTPKGWIKNICADARKLSQILRETDTIVTSPPYVKSVDAPNDPVRRTERMLKAGLDPKTIVGGRARCGQIDWQYGQAEGQIGNLPLGNVDVILTSPLYSEANRGGGIAEKGYEGKYGKDEKLHLRHDRPLSDNPDNISNMPLGNVDTVLTSPPYEASLDGSSRHTRGGIASRDPTLAQTGTYATELSNSPNPDNIGNLKSTDEEYRKLEVDVALTSPPYERQLHDSREKRASGAWKGSKLDVAKNLPMGYSENPSNIGNLTKETYLSAMLKVYGEMHKVLKPGGLAIIIVKAFIRNKKTVDLPWHTWLILKKAGFQLIKLYKLRLKQHSFWRVLYYKKHKGVPIIAHEYVLVCQKPIEGQTVNIEPQVDPLRFLLETIRREKVKKMIKSIRHKT